MSLTPRRPEIVALVELLEADDWESSEALAKALLKRSFELVQQRDLFVLGVPNGVQSSVYGPFASAADAERSGKRSMFPKAYVRPMWGEPHLYPDVLVTDKGACDGCSHSKGLHEHPKTAGRCQAGVGPKKSIPACTCAQFI